MRTREPKSQSHLRFFLPLIAGVVVFLVFTGDRIGALRRGREHSDFYTYWYAARFYADFPNANIYMPEGEAAANWYMQDALRKTEPTDLNNVEPVKYFAATQSPFFYSLMSHFSSGSIDTGFTVFQLFSNMVFLAALYVCFGKLHYHPLVSFLALLFILYLFMPFRSDFDNCNVNRLLFGCMVAGLVCLSRGTSAYSVIGGAIFGIAVMWKPSVLFGPIALFTVRALQRRWGTLAKEGGGFLAAIASAGFLSVAHFPSWGIWSSWIGRLKALPLEASPVTHGNFSLPALLLSLTGENLTMFIVIAGAIILSAACFIISRKSLGGRGAPTFREDCILLSLGILTFLLTSPLVWLHYYLLSLPLLLALVAADPKRSGKVSRLQCLAPLSVLMVSLCFIRFLRVRLDEGGVIVVGFIAWGGTLLAWVLGVLEMSTDVPESELSQ